jgi:hypothetical protein
MPEPNHDHKPDASTDMPQINKGPDWLRPCRLRLTSGERAGERLDYFPERA